jgi:UDP-N-acetylmuramoyl-L-alanyl-D-glutamate--2,6-diaminopimelate ligase
MNGVEVGMASRRLRDLLVGMADAEVQGALGERSATGVFDDSRRVQPGSVFVAVPGSTADGRRFVDDAVRRGAAVVVSEGLPPRDDVAVVCVPDARTAVATLALRWHGLAEDGCAGMKLGGITGTNGKSTTALMTQAILRAARVRCGLLGTVHYDLCGRSVKARMTTPGPLELMEHLRHCADAGAEAVVMEVSSHALDQRRTAGLRFAAGVFTNLSGDHLDYHGTFEAYREAKARLFADLPAEAAAIVNADDENHAAMLEGCAARRVTFGIKQAADVTAKIVKSTAEGTFYRLRIGGRELVLENAIVGRHNVYNALGAAALAHELGADVEAIAAGLAGVRNIPGRLQRVPCACPGAVFVDYAHTDDALRNVVSVLRPLTKGRLIVVFGAGGDRDRSKRPRMAAAVAEVADAIIVTSDNPRTEDPQQIIDDILAGFTAEQRRAVIVEPQRDLAIRAAVAAAHREDIVLIAGKGHEDYQVVGTERIHFDDVEVAIQQAAAVCEQSAGEQRS